MKGILIIMCIAFAWWCVSSFGLAGWGGISIAMLCVVLMIAVSENQPKDETKNESDTPKKRDDDDNYYM